MNKRTKGIIILISFIFLIIGIVVGYNLNKKEDIPKEELPKIITREDKINELKKIFNKKYVSILGDSISTYEGYSNDYINTNSTIKNNRSYYKEPNYIMEVTDTWWLKTINKLNMKLLVNNSFSGDKVITGGQTRSKELHDNTGDNKDTLPDIIFVYIGINDYIKDVTIEEFTTSYDNMINNIKITYPKTEIYILNLIPTKASLRNLDEFNNVIAEVTDKYNATLIDLNTKSNIDLSNCSTYMVDAKCLHPNITGMSTISNVIIDTLYDKYIPITEEPTNTKETIKIIEDYNYLGDFLIIIILSLCIIVGIAFIKIYENRK